MATQKIWGYDEARESFGRGGRNLSALGLTPELASQMGVSSEGYAGNGRSWDDILTDNAYGYYGQDAFSMDPQQLESIARSRGILGAKETSWGEDLVEGFSGPMLLPSLFLGAGLATGAFSGAGAAGAAEGGAALAGGGEVGSGYASSAPGWGGAGSGGSAALAGGGEVGSGYGASAPGVSGGLGGGMFDFSWKDLKDFAPIIGGILGGSSSSSPAGVTTTTEDLPEWLKPYASMGMMGLADAYKSNPTGVNPLTTAGTDYMQDVIGGDYLNNNPYLDDVYNRAAGKVTAGVNANFSKAGRYGSGAHQGVLGESLSGLATDIYAGNYNQERARQQQAGLMAPDAGASILNQRFLPAQNLLAGMGRIRGGTSSTPYFENKMASILGGALGAKQIFS